MKHDNREEVKQEHVGTPSGSKSVFKRIFSSRNRVIALISITVLLMGLQFIPGAKTAAGDLIYKIIPGACASTVSLNGSPEEMGAQHGQARKWSITLLMKIYVYGVICRNDEGKYEDGEELDQNVNRIGFHNAYVCFSRDGRTMYFTRVQTTGTEITSSQIKLSPITFR